MLKIRNKETDKVMNCTQSSWTAICERYGKEGKFEIVDGDVEIKPTSAKRKIEQVEVPPMPELPEHEEVKGSKRKRKNKSEDE